MEPAHASLEELNVSLYNSAFSYITWKSAIRVVIIPQKSANTDSSPAGSVVTYLSAPPWPYWWVNTGTLHGAPHGDSVGIIPNQYSAVYQPNSLKHSRAEYIVWPKVTQPVSGGAGILTPGVFCFQGSSSSAHLGHSVEGRFHHRQTARLYFLTSYCGNHLPSLFLTFLFC